MATPIINTQLDTLNEHQSNQVTELGAIGDTLEALNHLISHQNAAIDLLASDKKAALATDIGALVELIRSGELSEVMDYGDQIAMAWADGTTEYSPEMNLCHFETAELEGGEQIPVADFEWEYTLPFGTQFDAPEAIYYFDGTEGAGQKYIAIKARYGAGWVNGQNIQINLTDAPVEGDQLVIDCGANYANNPTSGRTWNVYAKGSTTSKQTGTTSNGTSGTKLGETSTNAQATNGKVNAPARVVYGYNRWAQSGLRQYLNSTAAAGAWWTAQNNWDRPCDYAASRAGFLSGYDSGIVAHFRPTKVVTVACDADSNVQDATYDRVFLASLEQAYIAPQFSGVEGAYWEYYKRLLGRTSPAQQFQTYTRLIKYALNGKTSAQYRFLRSATRASSNGVWCVLSSGNVTNHDAVSGHRCAPCVRIG